MRVVMSLWLGRWFLLAGGLAAACSPAAGQPAGELAPPAGAATMPPASVIRVEGKPWFPIGLYRYPKHDPQRDIFKAMAEAGFNLYLLPSTATKEELDAAQANGIRVMLVLGHLLDLSGTPEQIARKKKTLAEGIGPDSAAFQHPAVVALEGPDEPLWNTRYKPGQPGALPAELATWVRPAAEQRRVYALLEGLRDGYEEVHRLCGDRYQVWLNFAPRGDGDELRWFTELPAIGGYEQDGRTTADVFGTDIYPIPDGNGNNGWIRGRFVPSAATVGAFAEKLRRAVHPHPFYMVLQGCGVGEWNTKAVEAGTAQRRPTFTEQQFMVFDAIVHGAAGILYWGANYIPDDSLYWQDIARVNQQLRVLAPVLAEGTHWPGARSGLQEVTVLGKVYRGDHYVLATNNHASISEPGWVAVPGWRGERAYGLLDGREVPVADGVIRDTIPPLSARVYTDGKGPAAPSIRTAGSAEARSPGPG